MLQMVGMVMENDVSTQSAQIKRKQLVFGKLFTNTIA